MKCTVCGKDNQSSPRDFYSTDCFQDGNKDCIFSDKDKHKDFIAGRWEYIQSIRPKNPIPIALELAKKFREENEWCQKGRNKGQCMLASDEFTRVLDMEAISSSVQFGTMQNKPHCWVEVFCPNSQEPFIIDMTADQFDFCEEEVVCIPVSKMKELGYEYEKVEETENA